MIAKNNRIHAGGCPSEAGNEKRHAVEQPGRSHLIRVAQIQRDIKISHLCTGTVQDRHARFPMPAHIETKALGKQIKQAVSAALPAACSIFTESGPVHSQSACPRVQFCRHSEDFQRIPHIFLFIISHCHQKDLRELLQISGCRIPGHCFAEHLRHALV